MERIGLRVLVLLEGLIIIFLCLVLHRQQDKRSVVGDLAEGIDASNIPTWTTDKEILLKK